MGDHRQAFRARPDAHRAEGGIVQAGCSVVFLTMFLAIWCTVVITADAHFLGNIVRNLLALNWPTTAGVIEDSDVRVERTEDGETSRVDVTFSYEIDGRRFTSTIRRFGDTRADDGFADEWTEAHPEGATVTVYYDPARPGRAILEPGITGMDLFVVMFITPFNAVAVGALWFVMTAGLRKIRSKPPAVRIAQRGWRLGVKLPVTAPIATAGIAIAVASFAMIFVIGFTAGFHPPLWGMVIAWTVVLLLAATLYVRDRIRMSLGMYDLGLREESGEIVLPITDDRKANEAVPVERVEKAWVRFRRGSNFDGDVNHRHIAMLVVRDANNPGRKHRHRIHEFTKREPADALVDFVNAWLEEQRAAAESSSFTKRW